MADNPGDGHDAVVTDDVPGEPMSVDVRRRDGASVIRLSGEVDMLTTPTLRARVTEELDQGASVLVLDMLSVDFLGSSGLALLVEALEESRTRRVALRLVADSRPVTRPLAATGLTDLFETYPTLGEALGS